MAGAAFKKVYYDPTIGRQTAPYVQAEDLIMPYGASNVYTAERVTHIMRKTENDIKKLQVAGFYRDVELGEPVRFFTDIEKKKAQEQGYTLTEDDRYQLFEIHVDWNLKGYEDEAEDGNQTGVGLPYIITYDPGTPTVLGIRLNREDSNPTKLKPPHLLQFHSYTGLYAVGIGQD